MATVPSKDDEASHSKAGSVRSSQNGLRSSSAPIASCESSAPSRSTNRRVEGITPRQSAPKAAVGRPAGTTRRPAIDDVVLSEWLGGSDLSEASNTDDTPSKTASMSIGHPTPNLRTSDDALLARIADRLAEKNIPSFQRIGLDIKNGIITVRGTVNSKGERLLLMHILRTTPGVRTVQDGLVLTGSRSSKWTLADILNSIPVPSMPSLDSIQDAVSSVRPAHAAVAVVLMTFFAFVFWPRGVNRPVAVYPVKGRVVMDGAPYAEATVVLHPTEAMKLPSGVLPRGSVKADGSLVFQTFNAADGSPEGSFVATVHLMKPVLTEGDVVPGPDLAPAVYRTPETSPFRITITRDTKEITAFELHKRSKPAVFND